MRTHHTSPLRRHARTLGLAVGIALLGACASGPKGPSPELARLMSEVDRLEGDTRIAAHADAELKRADAAVQLLVDSGRRMDRALYQQRLYLADRLVQIAEAEGLARYAEQRGKDLGRDRERLLVEARTRQLERAKNEAEAARLAAVDARERAAAERLRAAQAQGQASMARAEAEQARLAMADSEAIAKLERERAASAESALTDAQSTAAAARSEAEQARLDAEQARLAQAEAQARSAAAQAELEQLRTQLAELQAKPTERGLVVTLGDVLFELDRAELKPGGQRTLDTLATAMRDRNEVLLQIEGHTDATGSRDYNLELSQRRAQSVAQYLQAQGIATERLQVRGLGPDFPVASNGTEAGRQQNRRVEVVLQSPVALTGTAAGTP